MLTPTRLRDMAQKEKQTREERTGLYNQGWFDGRASAFREVAYLLERESRCKDAARDPRGPAPLDHQNRCPECGYAHA